MKLKLLFTIFCVLLATIGTLAQSPNNSGNTQAADADQIPRLLSYQGVLHDNEGIAAADGSYAMTFTLYGQAESADALWSETRQVELAGGVFHVHLGSVNALSLPFDRGYWLGIAVGEGGELAPRIALTATPYSFMARTVADGAVTGNKLASGAVTTAALADSAVTGNKLHPDTDITTTGTITAGVFTGDGSGLTGLPTGEFSLPFTGEVSTSAPAFNVRNSWNGIRGETTLSVQFILVGQEWSNGVTGLASGLHGASNGVYGQSNTEFGSGVHGMSTRVSGRGVYGRATTTVGTNYGIYGESSSNAGRGVYGVATSGSGTNYGVYGVSQSTSGIGVYGETTASSGINYAIYGKSEAGTGIFGISMSAVGGYRGVHGLSASISGTGVYGQTTSTTGKTFAVLGEAASPEGYAAYFRGVQGSKNYFSHSVGIGTENPDAMLHLSTNNWVKGILESPNTTERGYLGFDHQALALSTNTYWTGSQWAHPVETEAAMALLLHRGNKRFEFRVRPEGGNQATVMVINTDQNVGIGTTNPGSFRLAVNGDAAKPGGGSWSVFSDQRLKRDIRQLEPGVLDRLLSIQGYTFEYLDEAVENRLALPGRQTGLIAQEVIDVFPDWVGTDEEGYLYVTERGLTALLIEALRELRQEKNDRIAELIREKQELETRLENENRENAIRLERIEASLGIPSPAMKAQN